jgi:hypothetical protein
VTSVSLIPAITAGSELQPAKSASPAPTAAASFARIK